MNKRQKNKQAKLNKSYAMNTRNFVDEDSKEAMQLGQLEIATKLVELVKEAKQEVDSERKARLIEDIDELKRLKAEAE